MIVQQGKSPSSSKGILKAQLTDAMFYGKAIFSYDGINRQREGCRGEEVSPIVFSFRR
jgi:hypothetical protein